MAISIGEIARQAGVSKMTVSRVINNASNLREETRRKVQRIIDETGYARNVFAQNLAKGVCLDIVGVITGIENVFSKYYFVELIRNMENWLDQKEHSVFIFNVVETENRERLEKRLRVICDQYHARAIKGVVILGPPEKDERLSFLSGNGVKGIAVGSKFKNENFGYIDVNNTEGVGIMVNYLVKKGHSKIAVINGPAYLTSAQEREQAFYAAMLGHGLKLPKEYVVSGGFNVESGRIAARKIFSCKEWPTAIFAMNDDMAKGVYEEAKVLGIRIPEDISVVGFDDLDFAKDLKPGLTTIGQPFSAIGSIVARRFETQDFDIEAEVSPVLVERNSVCSPI